MPTVCRRERRSRLMELCQVCGKNPATVHYTEIENNQMTEMHLCEECARKQGGALKAPFTWQELLAGLADLDLAPKAPPDTDEKCSQCGMTYSQFRERARLGCPHCYQSFHAGLEQLLGRIHGSTHHTGKVPSLPAGEVDDRRGELRRLRSDLARAVEEEAFEEAARLRDRIRQLQAEEAQK